MRDYDPTTGRYLQGDPLGLVDGASVYGYALQNPGRYTDPTGEFVPQMVACLVNPWCRTLTFAAGGVLLGYLFDDDGCYSIREAFEDAVKGGASGWAGGKALGPVFRPTGPFRRGGPLSTGRYFRIGWNRNGGRQTFRYADRWDNKIDFYDGGPL